VLAQKIFGTDAMPAYKVVFIAAGVGMLISLLWFWFGRAKLQGIGAPLPGNESMGAVVKVLVACAVAIPLMYLLLAMGAKTLQVILTLMFIGLGVMLLVEGIREGAVARDKVVAMLIIFA